MNKHTLRLMFFIMLGFGALVAWLAGYVSGKPAVGAPATLTVQVSGIANAKGGILASVCDKAHFLKTCNQSRMVQADAGGSVKLHFDTLRSGRFAVMVYHDENGNRQFDYTAGGMPAEGWGFSRNARGKQGPPRFEDAAIDLKPGANEMRIELVY
ncbi:DUF2141 domain-containing protein [Parachitinimonas caeni]|uniref:DUF2141 domain-containing protein n=1 Tax=Parachitinimonas caeni TaxID=3031301 RepID=A0ABT7DTA8_9NEIS|nr:DUF2141 domain-containing protein [Parachitinimonas caeni]MDK2123266.1 DUF2141 domain-containing protein [Parachitinimonas caeni]